MVELPTVANGLHFFGAGYVEHCENVVNNSLNRTAKGQTSLH